MKNALIIVAAASFLVFTSCKKEIYGCTNSDALNYSAVANKDDGSCLYEKDPVKSTTVTISHWTQSSNSWVTTIPYGDITIDAVDNGAIMVYMENGTNIWDVLPLTVYESTAFSTTIQVSITVGQVIVSWHNSDGSLPTEPSSEVFKISVIN